MCILLKQVLVSPASNAVSERSASGLRPVKTYLRSTMSQQRLNNLMVLHVHKDKLDKLTMPIILNEFIEGNEHRIKTFGNFEHFFHKPCISLMITIIIIATYLFLSKFSGRVAIYVEFVVEGVIWPYRLNFASYGPETGVFRECLLPNNLIALSTINVKCT